MRKKQEEKLEEKLFEALNNIFNDLWGAELSFDKIINEIFIKVILEMKINANYDIEKISKTFKIALFQAIEREYSINREEVESIVNAKTH